MPDLLCEHCGTRVKVRGLAAVCPNCKELVTPPPASIAPPEPLLEAPATEPIPSPLNIPEPREPNNTWKIVGITLAALLGLVFLIDYARLRLKPPTIVQVVQPAPPAPPPRGIPPATEPAEVDRVSILSEEPRRVRGTDERPTTRPAPSPPPTAEDEPSPPPSAPAVTQPSRPPHPYASLAAARPQAPQNPAAQRISDEQIGQSIQRGVDFILSQFAVTRLKGADQYDPETFAGLNALCVYALLHAGQAISDQRLGAQGEQMKTLIARMKEFPMSGNRATYSRALRISALAVYDRPEDRAVLQKDAEWLMNTSMGGAYTYGKPNTGATRAQGGWDNSNAQYGALGVWAATEAGFRAPASYWTDVENHWVDSQTHSGGWGYGPGAQAATLAMTSAGVTSLFVAREQLGTTPNAPESTPLPRAIERGLEWLDEGDHAIELTGHRGYTLYGLERAGLASGYKFFGRHDWYLTLAARTLNEQRPDGSWDGTDGPLAETAFSVLFLSRGRHPIFVSKLRFAGNWANRPRDIANLTRFAGRELERPLNWQTVGLERDWVEWTDSPVLFITSDQAPDFTDADIEKFRAYIQSGGMLFTHAEKNSPAFNVSIESLARRLFPSQRLAPIPADHVVHSVMYPDTSATPLLGIGNGSRLLMVHSPTDLGRAWTVRPIKSNRPSFEAALNVIVYAAGRREFRNRLNSIHVPPPSDAPVAIMPVARLRYAGNWDPEPAAWERFARVLQKQTSLSVKTTKVDMLDLDYETAPIAHLTGTDAITLNEADIDALRQFVVRGGVLLIDACGGSQAFSESVHKTLLPRLFPSSTLEPLDSAHPLLSGSSNELMSDLTRPMYRPYVIETRGRNPNGLASFAAGKGQVIVSDLDVISGLLGTGTWGIAGYQPDYAQNFTKNLVLWTLQRIRRDAR